MNIKQRQDKKISVLLIFLIFCGLSGGGSFWARSADATEIVPPNIKQLLSIPGGNLLALSEDKNGLFFSSDNGKKWVQSSNLPDTFLYSMSADTRNRLFLSTAAGIYRSTDGGSLWHRISKQSVAFLAFGASPNNYLIKIWGKGLYHASEKQSASVKTSLHPCKGLPQSPVQCVVISEKNIAYAGFFGKGVYQSTDGGRHWREANAGLANKNVLTIKQSPGGVIFAGTYGGGLYARSDGKTGWSSVNTGSIGTIIQCLAFGREGLVLAGTRNDGVIFSRDSGKTWQIATDLPPGASIHGLAVGRDGAFYAGLYDRGMYVSRDNGETWRFRPFAYAGVVYYAAAPPGGRWYIGVKGLGVLFSDNRGIDWSSVHLPFPPKEKIFLATQGDKLIAGTSQHGPYMSTDGGAHWEKKVDGLPKEEGINTLQINEGDVVFTVSADGKGLYRLASANTWEKIIADEEYGDNYSAWNLLFLPSGEAVSWGYNDILMSSDRLSGWHRTRFGQSFQEIWVDRQMGIWTRRMLTTFVLNGLENDWQSTTEIPDDRYVGFTRIDVNQFIGVRIDTGADILRWTGSQLIPQYRCLSNEKVRVAARDDAGAILVGTEKGLWVSDDSGRTWREVAFE